jgi:hypothetical protein
LVGYSNVHDYRDPNSNPCAAANRDYRPHTWFYHISWVPTARLPFLICIKKLLSLPITLTLTSGKNTWTFGTHNEFYNITYNFVNAWNGRDAYSSIDAFTGAFNSNPATTVAFTPSRVRANFNYTNNTRDYILANPSAQFKVNLLSAYAQDELQATDNLKLTFGARLDYAGVPNKQPLSDKTINAAVDPNYGNTFTYTPPKDIKNHYLNNVEINPRFSFNWDVNGDQSAVVRGGSGTFTGRVPFAWFGYAFYNNGVTYGAYDKNNISAASPITPGTNPTQAPANGGLGFVNQQTPAVNTSATGATQVDMIDNNFKMPQVWRSSLAFDYKTQNQWRFTVEGIYTSVIHDLKFQQTNTTDQVTYYPYDTQKQQPIFVNTKPSANFTNAYLLSNTSQGHRYSVTGQIGKTMPFGLSVDAAYTYGKAFDITNGIRNSMESNWQLNQALNPNTPTLAYSNFDVRSRIVTNLNYKITSAGGKSSSNFAIFFSAASGTPYTFGFYPSAIDGTGQQVSLAYIPSVGETIKLFSTTPTAPTAAEQAQANAFDQFINSDQYLSSRRGKFTERNGARTPWNTNADFRFTQDFKIGGEKTKQVLTFTFDIINLTNLLNSAWGHYYYSPNTFNSTSSIGLSRNVTPSFANAATTYPTYKFVNPGVAYAVDQFASRYQMQFGIRYSF